MIDWTSVLIGVGTSLIATGLSGVCKFVFSYTKRKRAQAHFKKSSKPRTDNPYLQGSYSRTTRVLLTADSCADGGIDGYASTHPDNDHFEGLILIPHHGSHLKKI